MAKKNNKNSASKSGKPQRLFDVTVCIGDWWVIRGVPAESKSDARSKVLNDNYDKSKMEWLCGDFPKPTRDNKYRIEVQPWNADNKNLADGEQKPINYRQEIKFGSVEEVE